MKNAWRKRSVKKLVGGPFLARDFNFPLELTCWMPLQCTHQGGGRVAWTPHVTHAERSDGEPRQSDIERVDGKSRRRVVDRLPTICSCCISDPFRRAAWWHHVNLIIGDWEDRRDGPGAGHFARDEGDILGKLLEVVPGPTPEGQAEFDAYRLEKEAWWKEVGEREYEEQRRARQEEAQAELERAEYMHWKVLTERLRAAGRPVPTREEFARACRDQDDRIRARMGIGPAREECLAILGLEPGATAEQIKAAYRALAKVHHSDLGGDDEAFVRLKGAYDRAMGLAGKASA